MIFIKTYHINSQHLQREVALDVYFPSLNLEETRLQVLLVNDGQDLAKMDLKNPLQDFYAKQKVLPVVMLGIHAGAERLQEYGVSQQPDFKKRGAKAKLYSKFVVEELLPWTRDLLANKVIESFSIAGFSLGALSAFDIAWNNAEQFKAVGAFSAAFWWRKHDLGDNYTDNDRILHEMLRKSKQKPHLRFWLMAGTADETADRNNNYIIDSIDDTIDVIKELELKGYSRPQDIKYFEAVGGQHNTETWAKVFPKFFDWIFTK